MSSAVSMKKDNNQLLRWLIVVSLLIHIPIYLHMNGMLTTDVLEYIDLSIRKTEDSSGRRLLHPPQVLKNRAKPGKVKASIMAPVQVPENSKLYNESTEPAKPKLSNAGSVPLPGADKMNSGSGTGHSSSGYGGGGGGGLSKEDYMEMVRLKVAENNRFPPEAVKKKRGGVVTVQFVIHLDGTISDLKIIKPSPREELNRQALQAVRDATPFSKPPPYIFKKPIIYPLDVYFNVI